MKWISYRVFTLIACLCTLVGCLDIRESRLSGQRFSEHVARVATGEWHNHLLELAETVSPPRGEVLAAMQRSAAFTRPSFEPPSDPCLWWFTTSDGVRIPFALTRDCLVYYRKLLNECRNGDFSGCGGLHLRFAELTYSASVTDHEEVTIEGEMFRNVSVVSLDLKWEAYVSEVCSMEFRKRRVVVFDTDGRLLKVFYDGATPVVVS